MRNGSDEGRGSIESIGDELVADGVLEPLADSDRDARLWMDCELCAFVENRFHETLEPTSIGGALRDEWCRRALAKDERLVDPRTQDYRSGFWIVDRGTRVGNLALATRVLGQSLVPVSSLYVFPARRAGGCAYRTLSRVQQAVVSAGHPGIRVATHWTWQSAVRRYLLRYRMWAWSFKRSVDFVWMGDLPPHIISIDEREARFCIDQHGTTIDLIAAVRDGDRLVWTELSGMKDAGIEQMVRFHARSTLAVALAINGWPLLRAAEEFAAAAGYDIGGPDVLARKIAIFEWLDRGSGFDVQTPRIPGLPYGAIARDFAET